MEDEFGEIDPDEVDIDPGSATATTARRRWLITAAVASVVGLAGGALLVWSPWRDEKTTSFPNDSVPALTLTEQLVFDEPPADLAAASLGGPTDDEFGSSSLDGAEGYFFAEPGARWSVTGAPSGTFAGFAALPEDSDDVEDLSVVEDGDTVAKVQGARAVVSAPEGGLREISFGPVDGLVFSTVTSGMTLVESMAFAEGIGVDDGVPTVSDAALGAMLPVGDIGDYSVAISTLFGATSVFGAQEGMVTVHYGELGDFGVGGTVYAIATQPIAGDTTLGMLRFIVGGEEGSRVHGQPATAVDDASGLFFPGGEDESALVAWIEGGRLIVVAGPAEIEAILELAETVRPATDDEWAAVVEISQVPVLPDIDFGDDFGDADLAPLYDYWDIAAADVVSYRGELVDGELTICTSSASTESCSTQSAELPLLITDHSDGRSLVLAAIEGFDADGAELRITLADGTIETHPLEDLSPWFPGLTVATLLPEDHGAVELWVGDELVKTLDD